MNIIQSNLNDRRQAGQQTWQREREGEGECLGVVWQKEMATKTQINDTQLRQIARFHVAAILFEVRFTTMPTTRKRERERGRKGSGRGVQAEVLRVAGAAAGVVLHDISFL